MSRSMYSALSKKEKNSMQTFHPHNPPSKAMVWIVDFRWDVPDGL